MREVFKQLILMIREFPNNIENYLYDCVTDMQASDIKSMSLSDNEIWLI